MSNKRIKEIRNLTKDELATKGRELSKALFDARMKHRTGQLEDTASMRRFRKDLARINGVLAQKQSEEKARA